MCRHHNRVGVLVGAFGQGLEARGFPAAEAVGVCPRQGVVNGHHGLVARVVHPVVPVEGREQARGVHHSSAGQAREAELPGHVEFAARQSAFGEVCEAGK